MAVLEGDEPHPARIRELTDRRRWAGLQDIRQVVEVLNPVLRGWGNYFRTGNASLEVPGGGSLREPAAGPAAAPRARLGDRRPFSLRDWPPARFAKDFRLHRLVGTIRYPGLANAS